MSILIAACWLTAGHDTTFPILANWGPQGRAIPNLFKWNVLVTSYEMMIVDSAHLKTIDWRYTVIDEAHRLKNKVSLFASTTQLSSRDSILTPLRVQDSKLVMELQSYGFSDVLLLTGTPLQNSVEELWSLLIFLDPQKF